MSDKLQINHAENVTIAIIFTILPIIKINIMPSLENISTLISSVQHVTIAKSEMNKKYI